MIFVNGHGYLIVIERGDGNFGAWAPDLPGCVAVGDTIAECEQEMRAAIAFHIDGLREEGEPVPTRMGSIDSRSRCQSRGALAAPACSRLSATFGRSP